MALKSTDYQPTNKPELVMEHILEAIRNEAITVGAFLPPERTLAEELGISRNSLRECLSIMDYLGVTEKRSNRRVLVKPSYYFEEICDIIKKYRLK